MTPVRREGYKFCQDICIPCYDTDARANLRPSAFMDFAQEIAYWAASELGFGYDTLHVHHTAWVLTRMHIHFEEPLKWRDNVTLYTWHKGASGLFYLRDFDLRDSSGKSRLQRAQQWPREPSGRLRTGSSPPQEHERGKASFRRIYLPSYVRRNRDSFQSRPHNAGRSFCI